MESQLSINQHDEIEILADLENKDLREGRKSLFKMLNKNSIVLFENVEYLENEFLKYFQQFKMHITNNIHCLLKEIKEIVNK